MKHKLVGMKYMKTSYQAMLIVPVLFALTACQVNKVIPISTSSINSLAVNQRHATRTHPAQFYLCGDDQYPCHAVLRDASRFTQKSISCHNKRKEAL
jgi:hypothetical protein